MKVQMQYSTDLLQFMFYVLDKQQVVWTSSY